MPEPSQKNRRSSVFIAAIFGALLVGSVAYLFTREPPLTDPRALFMLRILVALGAAGLAAALPGFLELELKPGALFSLRAGGALAVFVLIYQVNPPEIVPSCQHNVTQDCPCPGGRTGVQACTSAGAWTECNCTFPGYCEPGASRECPCAGGSGFQSCNQHEMWNECRCPGEPKVTQHEPGDPSARADLAAREKLSTVELAGTWRSAGDTIQFMDTGNDTFQITGTSLGPDGISYQVAGVARRTGSSIGMDLTLSAMGIAVGMGQATMTLQNERYMAGNLTLMNGVSTAWQLARQ
jgi:hypothetical protein